MSTAFDPKAGFLQGIRVLELADEKGEFAGKVLAGLGAEVIKVEPPGGSRTRWIGPFADDEPGIENSLFFWHYNLGKRGITLDLESQVDRDKLTELAAGADVIVETHEPGRLAESGLDYETLSRTNSRLIYASITPFGQTGPWRDYKANDLVHLALGGEMNYTRYPLKSDGTQDTPPIAPQMWQSYQMAGDHAVMAILAALIYRMRADVGQYIDVPIHQVCAVTTELDMPAWIYNQLPQPAFRLQPALTRDGRYMIGGLPIGTGGEFDGLLTLLKKYGAQQDLEDEKYRDAKYRTEFAFHISAVSNQLIRNGNLEDHWNEAQELHQLWAPIRKPEENLNDANWNARTTFGDVVHPERGATYRYPTGRWYCEDVPTQVGPQAPRLGEHNESVLEAPPRAIRAESRLIMPAPGCVNSTGRRFALEGIRVLDLTWMLASAGGPKVAASLGAECIRIEWRDRLDMLRSAMGIVPDEGKPVGTPTKSVNRAGYFNDINAGRRGISLNMNTPEGKAVFKRLVEISDVVVEGFTATMMERWGFGYENLKKIKPDIVYVQQSGMGKKGSYANYRSLGPIAQAITGITELSGLPEPFPPVGWLYSYLDFVGAYNCALAILAGMYYKQRTGNGVYIDSSQLEPGIYYTGTAILDSQVNRRPYSRTGNRSPYLAAAPHGAFPCNGPQSVGVGNERWIAIACTTPGEWEALCTEMGNPPWARDARFASLEARCKHQGELEAHLSDWTRACDAYELMDRLQHAGIPAGVCQTAEERAERDPHLGHLEWLTPLHHGEIGEWRVKDFPVHLSETPAYQGGPIERAAPCYGEDNQFVYGTLLGMSNEEIRGLEKRNVI